jgi:soluble lytic murein transglycosylase-like protein
MAAPIRVRQQLHFLSAWLDFRRAARLVSLPGGPRMAPWHWLRLCCSVGRAGLLLPLLALVLGGQEAPPPAPARSPAAAQRESARAVEGAVAKQRESVRRMMGSVAAQRASAARYAAPSYSPSRAFPAGADGPSRTPASQTPPLCSPLTAGAIAPLIQDASAREGLAARLLTAVIERESAFVPCAVSSKGALGLMQLMPATAEQLGVLNPFNPKENVDAGAKFLKSLLVRYGGDLALALGAYNAGPAKVDAAAGVPAIPETLDYVKDILSKIGE